MKKKYLLLFFMIAIISYGNETTIELDSTIIKNNSNRDFIIAPKQSKNTFTVTQEQIQERSYKNVEDVLQDAPGIIVNNTAFGPKIDMRGNGDKSLSKVKVMVDGISINPTEEAMASLPINSIPIASIKKIEIIPGGGATLYGSGSVGGVVNIITNSNATKDNFFMDMKYGSYDNRSFGFSGGNNITDALYVNYGFNYLNSEGYRKADDTQDTLYLVGFDYKINSKNKIRFQGRHGKQIFDSTTDISKEMLEVDRTSPGLNMDTDATNNSYTLDFEHRFNDKLSFGLTGYRQVQERNITADSIDDIQIIAYEQKSNNVFTSMTFEDIKSKLDAKFKEQKDGIKLAGNYNGSVWETIFGYDYLNANNKRKARTESEILKKYSNENGSGILNGNDVQSIKNSIDIDLTKEVHSLYNFNKIKITENFDFTFGGRGEWTTYDGYRKNGPNSGPRIPKKIAESKINKSLTNYAGEAGAIYRYNDTGSTYVRYERGFVTPFASQLTDKIKDNKLPNPNGFFTPPKMNTASIYVPNGLEAETTDTIELGFRDYILNSFMSLSLYMTDTKDEITTINSGATNPAVKRWKYRNIGKTRRKGLEFITEQKFNKFSLNQSISYVDARILKGDAESKLKKDDKIPMVPKYKFTFGGKYDLTNKLSLLANYNYVSEKETRELNTKGIEEEYIEKYTLKAQGTVDAGILYKIDDYSNLKFGVKNLTNKQYNLRETSKVGVPAAERNYYIELNVKF